MQTNWRNVQEMDGVQQPGINMHILFPSTIEQRIKSMPKSSKLVAACHMKLFQINLPTMLYILLGRTHRCYNDGDD
jgi:hypothetical protein